MNELITAFPIANISGVYEQHDARSPFDDIVQSIKNHGLWSPVVIHKETSFLITGHSRVLACTKLGEETIPAWLVDCPPGSPEARLIAIESDLVGKWFNELEVSRLMAERKKLYLDVNPETAKGVAGALAKHGCANDKMSFAETAAHNANLSKRSIERKISIGEKMSPNVFKELELHGDKLKAKKFSENQTEQLKLVKHPQEMQDKIIKRLLDTDGSALPQHQPITSVAHAIQSLKHEANIGKHGVLADKLFPLVNGSFESENIVNGIADKSVSLIATDMPYGKEGLHLIEPLFKLYAPKLKDDGHIAIMYGQDSEPAFWEVVNPLLTKHGLVYRGQMIVLTPKGGPGSCKNAGMMIHHYKPIAVLAKPHKYHHSVNDVIYGDGKSEKDYFEWQQKEQDFVELINRLTEPSDLVFDPMAGSGTTGVAALKTGRRFFGIEKDWATFEIAKTRFINEELVSFGDASVAETGLTPLSGLAA
jgi:hypothetical protein